jgi:hypothetical protein
MQISDMRSLVILISVLFVSLLCCSQDLYRGRLVSALTGKPIRSGYIEMNDKIIADTDTLGFFTIKLDSPDKVALAIYASEVGWIAVEGLQFKANETLVIPLTPECLYSAQSDIEEGKIKLLLIFNAFSSPLSKQDLFFEKKYKLTYYGYGEGCTGILTDCIDFYNNAIGKFLDKKYGKKWRGEVNREVSGL